MSETQRVGYFLDGSGSSDKKLSAWAFVSGPSIGGGNYHIDSSCSQLVRESEEVKRSTNNYAELTAVLEAVKHLQKRLENGHVVAEIFLDSEYVMRGLFEYEKTKKGENLKLVATIDSFSHFNGRVVRNGSHTHDTVWENLLQELRKVCGRCTMYFYWVRAHHGYRKKDGDWGDCEFLHSRADKLANDLVTKA